ncbi:MAG: DNA polymerase III subunit gamma/tau [Proteobacteria bacterium]|nr:DNA polymerase III subunit gamma/tau [Pseudomonadota bacterium]
MADTDFALDDDLAPEADQRDDATFSMFEDEAAADDVPADLPPPDAPPAAAAPYTVLARKYRPRTFEDLIGQEAMVRTLTNAFSTGRIAHAFMLTGVRGVGKTTTARLLARALNYEREGVNGPSVDLSQPGVHDQAINEGRHIDVMELDAASHTGVDNMRDLLDSVRYAPVQARNKVYVIDEVHMLSKGAFNALLKTLEEPPPHAKFIFATTEIRKVPVTILSRCQRFDLRRVEPEVLTAHLQKVCDAEGAQVDEEGLRLIARAAEGSVRDALSLLDQAIVQADRGQVVDAAIVRDMLGLADRAATIGLFETVMKGDAAAALRDFRLLHGYGADPAQVTLDLLEHAHAASVAKTLGEGALHLPRDQSARLAALGSEVSAGTLARTWQMLMRAHDEVRRAPDGAAAVEMALIRLCYAADLPGPEEALRRLAAGEPLTPGGPPSGGARLSAGGGVAARAVAAPARSPAPQPEPGVSQPGPAMASLDDLAALVAARRDPLLAMDIAQYVKPISFAPGRISFEPAPGAPASLAPNLSAKLKAWTGRPWMVVAEPSGGGETLNARAARAQAQAHAEISADPFVRAVLETFPGAEIVRVDEGGGPT